MNTWLAMTSPIIVPLGAAALLLLRARMFPRPRPVRHAARTQGPQGATLLSLMARRDAVDREMAALRGSARRDRA